ncbi:MAG: CRISPR-associated protein Cmr3 [Candidatus Roseilinea sp.]|nr:MAG: CRISPR-associated protein Cmr3 [Candidatus Roseilinea sp.]
MKAKALFLTPVDVWLFRDGRPFDAGDDHYARSLFPPYPSVLQGAIRSHHLVVQGVDLRNQDAIKATVGTAEDFGKLRMCGPFIACREADGRLTRYFPAPADAAPCDDAHLKAIAPQPAAHHQVVTGADAVLPRLFFPHPGVEAEKREIGSWLTEADLHACLNGAAVRPERSDALFVSEHRYGIGLDSDRRATQRGQLYAAEFVRVCDGVGLYVEVSSYDGWPPAGVMRIGGEGHAAHFAQVDPMPWPAIPAPLPSRFKVYFVTPTYFEDGWKPKSGWGRFFDGQVKLEAVALRGYESRGGYDWAGGGQKPARRFVPAGSVYYFSHDGSARLKSDLVNGAITELWPEIGFGQVIISEWKE